MLALSQSASILSSQQKEYYQQNGFLIIENFFSSSICAVLMERAKWLINNSDAEKMKVIFSGTNNAFERDHYFLESGDKIRFFFEEKAFDAKGELQQEKLLCINKIGHALHDLDPVFNCFSRRHAIATLAHDLAIARPLLIQSMYICKQPYIGGEVNPHQDSTYLYVKNQPVTGLWFALEDASLENGCLWAIPGAHQLGLKSRMVYHKNTGLTTEIYDDQPWPLDKMIPLPVPQGSVIVLHGLLPHMSKANTGARSRHAYTLHLMSADEEYAENNWLKRAPTLPFSGFL